VCMTDNKLIYVLIETHRDDKREMKWRRCKIVHIIGIEQVQTG
jgi:hypothetical protein